MLKARFNKKNVKKCLFIIALLLVSRFLFHLFMQHLFNISNVTKRFSDVTREIKNSEYSGYIKKIKVENHANKTSFYIVIDRKKADNNAVLNIHNYTKDVIDRLYSSDPEHRGNYDYIFVGIYAASFDRDNELKLSTRQLDPETQKLYWTDHK